MASDKVDSDAKRAKSRNFGGYLVDRVLGRADFDTSKPKDASAKVIGGGNSANDAALEAAGMKKANGGIIKSKRAQYR
jgi:hypothetical protein